MKNEIWDLGTLTGRIKPTRLCEHLGHMGSNRSEEMWIPVVVYYLRIHEGKITLVQRI